MSEEIDPPSIPEVLFLIEHDLETGRILTFRQLPRAEFGPQVPSDGAAFLEVDGFVDPGLFYLTDGALVARPALDGFDRLTIAADDVDAAQMTLPEPMTVHVDGQPYGPTDTVAITSPMPGSYVVEIRHFPWQDFRAVVVAS